MNQDFLSNDFNELSNTSHQKVAHHEGHNHNTPQSNNSNEHEVSSMPLDLLIIALFIAGMISIIYGIYAWSDAHDFGFTLFMGCLCTALFMFTLAVVVNACNKYLNS